MIKISKHNKARNALTCLQKQNKRSNLNRKQQKRLKSFSITSAAGLGIRANNHPVNLFPPVLQHKSESQTTQTCRKLAQHTAI